MKKRTDTASLTAAAHNVTPHYVRMVVNGKRNNEDILSTYNKIEKKREKLLKEVVPASISTQ